MTLKQKLLSALSAWVLDPLGLSLKEETDLLQNIYSALETYHYLRGNPNEEIAWKEVEESMNKYMSWQTRNGPFYITLKRLFSKG